MPVPFEQTRRAPASPVLPVKQADLMMMVAKPKPQPQPQLQTPLDTLLALIAQHTTINPVDFDIVVDVAVAQELIRRAVNNPLRSMAFAKRLARDMMAGRYEPTVQPMIVNCRGEFDDGRHRALAVVLSGKTQVLKVVFGANPKHANYYDLGIERTSAHVGAMHGVQRPTGAAALAKMITRIQKRSRLVDKSESTATMLDLHKAGDIAFAEAVYEGSRLRKLTTPAAAGLAYYFIKTQSTHLDKLEEFMKGLRDGINLPQGPILQLRRFLSDPRNFAGMRPSDSEQKVAAATSIIQGWNAYVEGRVRVKFFWDKDLVTLPIAK